MAGTAVKPPASWPRVPSPGEQTVQDSGPGTSWPSLQIIARLRRGSTMLPPLDLPGSTQQPESLCEVLT